MAEEIDTFETKYITCPYCGYEFKDSHAFMSDDQDQSELECEECGKTFRAFCDVEISYTTETLEDSP